MPATCCESYEAACFRVAGCMQLRDKATSEDSGREPWIREASWNKASMSKNSYDNMLKSRQQWAFRRASRCQAAASNQTFAK